MSTRILPAPGDPFITRLRRAVHDGNLVAQGQCVLVACSGGADSVTLLVGLSVLGADEGFDLRVAHVNHCLRGEDSDADARLVQRLAAELGLPLHLGAADVKAIRADRGGSVEEVARWARMSLLREMMRASGADLLATAHHQDDQAETVLMRCLRGSGLSGLSAMSSGVGPAPLPEGSIIRPFLHMRREEIRAALVRWGVPWREDASNRSHEFTRNRIRHALLPQLADEWNPRIVPALARLADIAAADDAALNQWADQVWPEVCRRHGEEAAVLDRTRLLAYPLGIRRRIVRRTAHALRTVRVLLSYAETERLVGLLAKKGRVTLRGKMTAWSTHGQLWLEALDAWSGPTPVRLEGTTRVPGWGVLRLTSDATDAHECCAWPRRALEPPVVIRRWRPGDSVITDAARPSVRRIADLARRASVDPREVLVVADAEQIIWAIGLATSAPPPSLPPSPSVIMSWERETHA